MNSLRLNPRQVQTAIRQLESLDPAEASITDFETHLAALLQGYSAVTTKLEAGADIYRARKCDKPVKLADISYPLTEFVTAPGRANDIGESIFYGAASRNVPFFEIGAQTGDHIALSKWRTTEPVLLNHVGFSSEPESLRDARRKLESVYEFVKHTREMGDLNSLVYDYLAYNFSRKISEKDGFDYKYPIAIARKLFSDGLFDGLIYPTIQMSGNADNIALKTDVVDKLLRFVSVEYVVVKERRGTKIDIDILDSATHADIIGTLDWLGRNLQWKLRQQDEQLTIAREGSEWVAYDFLGNRVDPE